MTGSPAGRVVAAVALAVAADALTETDGRLHFPHEAARSAVYASAGLDERRAVHLALADVVGHRPDRRAWHRAVAALDPDDRLASDAHRAAVDARSRDRLTDALALTEQAARLGTTPRARSERLHEAAELAHVVGRPERARGLAARVRSSAAFTSADHRRLAAVRSRFHLLPGDRGAGDELLGDVEALADAGETAVAARLLVDVAHGLHGRRGRAGARARAVALADRLGDPATEPLVGVVLALAAPERDPAVLLQALAGHEPEALSTETRLLVAEAAIELGDDDLAALLLTSAVADMRAGGHGGLLAEALHLRAWTATRTTTTTAARADLEEARALAEAHGQTRVLSRLAALEAHLEALGGRVEAVDRLAADAEGRTADRPAALAELEAARALARLGERRHAEAFDRYERLWGMGDGGTPPAPALRAVVEYADAARHAGEGDRARRRLVALDPRRHGRGLLLALALLADDGVAGPALESAVAGERHAAPLRRGQAHLAYGEWLRRERRKRDAQAQLELAREAFSVAGAEAWAARASAELRAAGAAVANRGPEGMDDLTAQELQIARLAAEGLSNREIGLRLFLSHRTIGSHLYRVFPKLGITTRAQLSRALDEHGLGAQPTRVEAARAGRAA